MQRYAASDASAEREGRPCLDASLVVNGQDFDDRELRRTLTIKEMANDGTHAVIVSQMKTFGRPGTFRYEFVNEGSRWKINDVVLPGGYRLSEVRCANSLK